MKPSWPSSDRKWLIVPPVVLGVLIVGLLVLTRSGPQRALEREESRVLRVMEAQAMDVTPRALGYGTARSGHVWRAVSEVRGRVAEVHSELGSGAMIREGELLLRIDPAEYELAIAQLEADIAQVGAQMDELVVQEANDRALLKIEKSSLALVERDLQRGEALRKQGAISESRLDQLKRSALSQKQGVQRLRNALKVVPQQRKALEALHAVKRAGLQQAELDLAKTEIKAPFDCRMGEVEIQPGQFLAAGQLLFEGHGTALTEVEIQIPLDRLRILIDPQHQESPPIHMDARTVQALFDFPVVVRHRSGDFASSWEGRIVRMRERLDPRTRTVGLVVAVDEPYQKAIPGTRPPLVDGMYCEAELRGNVRAAQIVIPRSALHDGYVYVVGEDDRLQRRRVEVAFTQSSFVTLRAGLDAGERVVVSDPTPAIEGSLVDPVLDSELLERLVVEASGQGSLQ